MNGEAIIRSVVISEGEIVKVQARVVCIFSE